MCRRVCVYVRLTIENILLSIVYCMRDVWSSCIPCFCGWWGWRMFGEPNARSHSWAYSPSICINSFHSKCVELHVIFSLINSCESRSNKRKKIEISRFDSSAEKKNTKKSFRAANTERQSSRILFIVIVRYVNDVNYIVDEQNDYIILNYLIFSFLFLSLTRSIALFLHTNYTILISLIVVSVDCRHRRFEFYAASNGISQFN